MPPDTPMTSAAAERVIVYSSGLVACSVCAPNDMPPDEVADAANRLNPTGISSAWSVSADATFHQGGPQPGPCDKEPETRTHYLMEC